MTSTHVPTRTDTRSPTAGSVSWLGHNGKPSTPPRLRGPRRRVAHLLLGVLLVVGCVGGAVWWSSSTQDRVPVLAIARPVRVGHVLESADLLSVNLPVEPGVATVADGGRSAVLGRPMAISLSPGALLTPDSVGAAAVPAPGTAVVAVGLKPGQFPPELTPGSAVTVVVTADPAGSAASGTPGVSWRATVVGVVAAGTDQTTVVSAQLDTAAAAQLAQMPSGRVALVLLPGGGR